MNIISGKQLFIWEQRINQEAKKEGISPKEIELIFTQLLNINSLSFKLKNYQHETEIKIPQSLEQLENLWQKRIKHRCPIQYLIGKCYWRDFCLQVTPDVLIPRPETELIIDLVQDTLQQYPHLALGDFLDLGTGSGAIAIALANLEQKGDIYAVDISTAALLIAQQNAQKYNLDHRINFFHGSWFEPLHAQKNSFSLIISNPPYIPSDVVLTLQPEVVNHEPKIALDGGKDGLQDIKYLIQSAPEYLSPQGVIIIEIMTGQSEVVRQVFQKNGNYHNINIYNDFANLDRFVMAQLKSLETNSN